MCGAREEAEYKDTRLSPAQMQRSSQEVRAYKMDIFRLSWTISSSQQSLHLCQD